MGEQVINKEEAKVEAEPKKEESPAPEAAPAPSAEEGKKELEEPPSPPPPVILGVELHCTGCAKRIRRSLLRCKGVEAVHVDTAANQVTVKSSVAVDPQTLCQRLRDKTKRDATVISPLPPPPAPPADGEPALPPPAEVVEDPVRTVELLVNMHCDACAEQLQRKMLKMKGVKGAETDLAVGKLTVTGTVEGEKIVEYIHRRTGKVATIVPPPEPPNEEEAAPPAEAEQKPADDKKEEDEKKPAAEGDQPAGEEKKEADAGDEKPGKQEGGEGAVAVDGVPPEEMMKRMVYWPYGGAPAHYSYKLQPADAEEAMMARRMAMQAMPPPPPHHHHHHPYGAMMQHQWMPPPPPPPAPMYYGGSSYMMERPPQMFSDENPNACVIS